MTTRLLGFGQVLKPNNPITFAHQIVRLLGFKTYAKPNNPKTLLKPVRSARFDSKPIIISRLLGYWVLKPPPKPNNPTVEMKRLLTPKEQLPRRQISKIQQMTFAETAKSP